MDHVDTYQQRNPETAFFHGDTLEIAHPLHAPEIEQTSDFAPFETPGRDVAFALPGDDVSRSGEVQLADFLFQRHARQKRVHETVHSRLRLSRADRNAEEREHGEKMFEFNHVASYFVVSRMCRAHPPHALARSVRRLREVIFSRRIS